MKLTNSQQAAIDHITEYAKTRKDSAQCTIDHVLRMSNVTSDQYEEAVSKIEKYARVALHFHPDRPDPDNLTVAEALLESGIYKSQFETKMSNGSVTAFAGGERDIWEKTVFGGSFHLEDTMAKERPKYGALNLMLHPDGPSPRFGSCYFLLKPEVSQRCTFTYLDSHTNPDEKGTFEEFTDVMAALLFEIFTRDFAIGEKDIMPERLIHHLLHNLEKPIVDPSEISNVRNLNHYIEAQVHGDVSLRSDVEALVVDPSFKESTIDMHFKSMAEKYGFKLYYHQGFQLAVEEVPSDFRGPDMPSLAERIAIDGVVDVSLVGRAAIDLKTNPEKWSDRGEYKNVLQELKLLWHVLVKYGKPHSAH